MNDIFDFGRFCKLFTYECRTYLPRFTKTLVTFVCILFAAWVATIVLKFNFIIEFRMGLISLLFDVACMLAPFVVYRDMNNRKRGYFYAMTPASVTEKFLSMLLICFVVAPFISFVAIHVTDSLLHWLTLAGIGGFVGLEMYNPFASADESSFILVFSYLTTITSAIMFNTIFRRNKIIKTILVYMAFVFSVIIIFFWLLDMMSPETMNDFISWSLDSGFWYYVRAVAMVIMLAYTYSRIKRVNY